MISDPEGIVAEDAAKPKAKARKKKVAEATPESAVSTEPAANMDAPAETSKPVKKVAKKAAKQSYPAAISLAAPSEPEVAADVKTEPEAELEAAPAAKKARKAAVKSPKKPAEPQAATEAAASEPEAAVQPEPKLERLQKILAKAGISSRRKAEELILGGQVQINGKVVTELGTKADPERDHVRVDGKLLQGPERIRYFVLNKPKGYVTTVSDPEGRPTVMQFFATERERLYPVGRLDYLSEGLLLVTNDGDLANKLTKAASGVEKTYLVKVAGQPTEDMLDVLRSGVVIERGRPGENTGRVRTAPAKIRQVREGDNPWYEVIIIDGRNRELRKMFEEIGHHVEKIRRVGYGPLVLDLEPGKLRELEPEEVHSLQLAAAGKLKKKSKRSAAAGQLPTVAGRAVRYKKPDGRPGYAPRVRPEFQTESKAEFKPAIRALPKAAFKPAGKPEFRPKAGEALGRGFQKEFRPAPRAASGPTARPDSRAGSRPDSRPPMKRAFKPGFKSEFGADSTSGGRPAGKPGFAARPKPGFQAESRPSFKGGDRPAFGGKLRMNRPAEPPVTEFVLPPRKGGQDIDSESKSGHQGSGFNPDFKPGFRTGGGAKPAFRSERPGGKPAFRGSDSERPEKPFRAAGPRSGGTQPLGRYNAADDDFVPKKTPGFRIEPVEDKPRAERPRSGGFGGSGSSERSAATRPSSSGKPFRPALARPGGPRPSGSRPAGAGSFGARSEGRPSFGDRPPRGGARPDRPVGRPDRPAARPRPDGGEGDAPREFRPRPAKAGGSFGAPKKFAGKSFGSKPGGPRKFDAAKPAPGGSNSVPRERVGADGQPRIKERHRNSFTGKNKGRPKPKSE